MRKIIFTFMLSFAIGITFCSSSVAIAQQTMIPAWVKNDALWWGQGQLQDSEFIKSIQWMINNNIIQISNSPILIQNTTNQTPDKVLQQITGEKPLFHSDGNVWIGTCSNICLKKLSINQDSVFSLYADSSKAAALTDYQNFVSKSINVLSTINSNYPYIKPPVIISWKSSANDNAQCVEMYLNSEISNGVISINTTPSSLICLDGTYVFQVGSIIGTNVQDVANLIISQIPNSGG